MGKTLREIDGADAMTQNVPPGSHRALEIEPGVARLVDADTARGLRPGEGRVRVLACGICGTDLHLLHGMTLPRGASYPVRPGHEVAGILTEVHSDAPGAKVGDLVVLHPISACRECPDCLDDRPLYCPHARVLGI